MSEEDFLCLLKVLSDYTSMTVARMMGDTSIDDREFKELYELLVEFNSE